MVPLQDVGKGTLREQEMGARGPLEARLPFLTGPCDNSLNAFLGLEPPHLTFQRPHPHTPQLQFSRTLGTD